MYTLPAAPPPLASVAAESPAALQRPGVPGAGAAVLGDVPADDGGAGVEGGADVAFGLAEPVPGAVVVCDCGWLAPHAVSISAAAAAAVVMANPWNIC
ncbi:hypothetical protein [Pseudarthrobacter phenanthrenivorans]|uniref:hypothetical protein n=1 Tax=Pseudarthrobacter phenanthrenivorans TaxID=361575 RepID=UPI00319DE17C